MSGKRCLGLVDRCDMTVPNGRTTTLVTEKVWEGRDEEIRDRWVNLRNRVSSDVQTRTRLTIWKDSESKRWYLKC